MTWASQKLFGTRTATTLSALGTGLVVAVVFALPVLQPPLDLYEAGVLDRLFVLRGARVPRTPITIVVIDRSTFEALDKSWPLPRRIHGEVLERLSAAGAIAVGLDLIFSTPSSHGPDDDAALAESARRARGVVMGAVVTTVSEGFYIKTSYQQPIPPLRTAATSGYVNTPVDADGGVRRAQLIIPGARELGGSAEPFAVELHRVAATNGIVGAPIPPESSIWINFAGGPGSFSRLPYHQVLEEPLPLEKVRGRIVLIGLTEPMFHDSYKTPFAPGGEMPGVEIQANILHTLLTGRRVKEGVPRWGRPVIAGFCAALSVVLVGAAGLRGPMLVVLVSAAVLGTAGIVFATTNVWLPTVAPSLALGFGAVVRLLFRS